MACGGHGSWRTTAKQLRSLGIGIVKERDSAIVLSYREADCVQNPMKNRKNGSSSPLPISRKSIVGSFVGKSSTTQSAGCDEGHGCVSAPSPLELTMEHPALVSCKHLYPRRRAAPHGIQASVEKPLSVADKGANGRGGGDGGGGGGSSRSLAFSLEPSVLYCGS